LGTAADHARRNFSVAYSLVRLESAAAAPDVLPAEQMVVCAAGPAEDLQQEEDLSRLLKAPLLLVPAGSEDRAVGLRIGRTVVRVAVPVEERLCRCEWLLSLLPLELVVWAVGWRIDQTAAFAAGPARTVACSW
jgi:hypothetical protein